MPENLLSKIIFAPRKLLAGHRPQQLLSNEQALVPYAVLGIVTGIVTGLIIILFRLLIDICTTFWLDQYTGVDFKELTDYRYFLVPTIGAFLLGLAMQQLQPQDRATGLPYTVMRMHNFHSQFPVKNSLVQFFMGAFALMTGQSGGREGPAIHLGGAGGSAIGYYFGLPDNSRRILVGCGCAAAIAASFNTPIAGVIFAMEVVIMDYTIAGFIPIILSAVAATVVARLFFGAEQFITPPELATIELVELSWVVLLSLSIAIASAVFVQIQKLSDRYLAVSLWLRFTIAGALTGTCALIAPQILGVSYDSLNDAISGNLLWQSLIIIAVLKLITAAVTSGVGMPIGNIGSSLVIGSCIGSLFGVFLETIDPGQHQSIELYALLGMGAMMGALLNAPLAALMALLELTNNTGILFPAMLVIVTANICHTAVLKQPSSIFTSLNQRHVTLRRDPVSKALSRAGVAAFFTTDFVQTQRVINAEQMRQLNNRTLIINVDESAYVLERLHSPEPPVSTDLLTLPQIKRCSMIDDKASLLRARDELAKTASDFICITQQGRIIGLLSLADIEQYLFTPPKQE